MIHMTVTSFWYFTMLLLGVGVYYIVPRRFQWAVLLVMSMVYYCYAAVPYTFLFLVFSTLVAYISTTLMDYCKSIGREKIKNIILGASITAVVLPWFLTSGADLWVSGSRALHSCFHFIPILKNLPVAAAIGMAYYTSQVISYMTDCSWGTVKRQKNPVKLLLYVCFFPQLTTGPISRYSNLCSLFEGHRFQYRNLCFGAQRILWGCFKKLVLADRSAIIINAVWNDLDSYAGFWHWIALLLYPLLIYADFSGCMDIVLGTAELFDIHLEENFKNPFFSKSIREFWSRWHVTLGKWAKDYIMFPILKSEFTIKITKRIKIKLGKRWGKFLPAAFAACMVWFVMGIWHGGFKHIIGVSLYYWILIELGEFFDPLLGKIISTLHINIESFSWKLFQRLRTYLIYAFGAVFFKADTVTDTFTFIKSLFYMFPKGQANPWIFFDGSILNTGITYAGLNLLVLGVLMLIVVSYLREKYEYARAWIAEQGLVFRWGIWIILFILVLIYGAYGPGYDASEFIYQGF